MLDFETDYTILSAHSKMAAVMPPCVQLLAVWFVCTKKFLRGRGQKMVDVTFHVANSQTQAQRRIARSMWSDDSTIQTDVEQLLALGTVADTILGPRCKLLQCECYGYIYKI